MANDPYFPRESCYPYSREGLAYRDLIIGTGQQASCPASVLYEQYYRCFPDQLPLYILTDEEMGEIRGYKRKVLREAYLLL